MSDILCVIPVKRHSSRLPNKNLLPLGGIPLFLWTVRAAREVEPPMTVMVSTDEGPAGDEIAKLAVHEGAIVIRRPPELCRDPAQAPDVALHALERYREQRGKDPETVVMLLPTSPFRTGSDVATALVYHQTRGGNVVSVTSVARDLEHKLCLDSPRGIVEGPPLRDHAFSARIVNEGTSPFGAWPTMLNGAIWVASAKSLRADGHFSAIGATALILDEESGLDIDSPLDYEIARAVVVRRYETVAA